MKLIKKLQNKSERERKIILWSIIIILGLILGSLWIYSSYRNIKSFKEQNTIKEQWIKKIEQQIK